MDNSRMSNADMLQYCDEALAWEAFGPIDIYFFESVKKILLGECSAAEEPDSETDILTNTELPVEDVELEPDYDKYADVYYNEKGEDNIPDYTKAESQPKEDNEDIFGEIIHSGFFAADENGSDSTDSELSMTEISGAGFTVRL